MSAHDVNTKRPVLDPDRRRFLRGAGASVALPLLPSLETKAFGADPVVARRPRLFWVTTDHGGTFEASMFPSANLLTNKTKVFDDHEIAHGTLTAASNGGVTELSPVLRAPSTAFTPRLLGKMNVLHGLDVPFYLGHHTGGHLGNFARNDGNGAEGQSIQGQPRPTIDQLAAYSKTFYPNVGAVRERSIVLGSRNVSYAFASPQTATGGIQVVRGTTSTRDVFDRLFSTRNEPGAKRRLVIDRVLEGYKQMRNDNPRLSTSDKQRLDEHMAQIDELERKLSAPPPGNCPVAKRPTEDARDKTGRTEADAIAEARLVNEVVAMAFMCGATRIAIWGLGSTERFSSFGGGSWHQDVAHQWSSADPQNAMRNSYQKMFEHGFLDLARRLDVEEADGKTYLDNTLMVWSQEHGMVTHETISIPVITFGSAAGAMKTGMFVDYRRQVANSTIDRKELGLKQYLGMLYNHWLSTVLLAMGVSRSEFELWGHKGVGVPLIAGFNQRLHYGADHAKSRYFDAAADMLPLLKA